MPFLQILILRSLFLIILDNVLTLQQLFPKWQILSKCFNCLQSVFFKTPSIFKGKYLITQVTSENLISDNVTEHTYLQFLLNPTRLIKMNFHIQKNYISCTTFFMKKILPLTLSLFYLLICSINPDSWFASTFVTQAPDSSFD